MNQFLICSVETSGACDQHATCCLPGQKWFLSKVIVYNIDWEEMFTDIDINTMWNKFITTVEEVIDKMVWTKILNERSYPKWMMRRAKLANKLKSTMWVRFRSG